MKKICISFHNFFSASSTCYTIWDWFWRATYSAAAQCLHRRRRKSEIFQLTSAAISADTMATHLNIQYDMIVSRVSLSATHKKRRKILLLASSVKDFGRNLLPLCNPTHTHTTLSILEIRLILKLSTDVYSGRGKVFVSCQQQRFHLLSYRDAVSPSLFSPHTRLALLSTVNCEHDNEAMSVSKWKKEKTILMRIATFFLLSEYFTSYQLLHCLMLLEKLIFTSSDFEHSPAVTNSRRSRKKWSFNSHNPCPLSLVIVISDFGKNSDNFAIFIHCEMFWDSEWHRIGVGVIGWGRKQIESQQPTMDNFYFHFCFRWQRCVDCYLTKLKKLFHGNNFSIPAAVFGNMMMPIITNANLFTFTSLTGRSSGRWKCYCFQENAEHS